MKVLVLASTLIRFDLVCLLLENLAFGFKFSFRDGNSAAISSKAPTPSSLENEVERNIDLMTNLEGQAIKEVVDHEIESNPREESSCYSRIFGSLTTHAQSNYEVSSEPSLCSVLSRSEAHRTAFAARLTICELETNHLTLPRECTLWIEAGSEPNSEKLQACVGALHASPQSWSSFTGHQREAIQLCFAHHKLQGIEIATSLNQKTIKFTTEMIRLGRMDQKSNREELQRLRDHLKSLFDQSVQNFDSVSEKNRQASEKIFQELENRFQGFKQKLYDLNQGMWNEFSHQNLQQLHNINNQVQSLNTQHEVQFTNDLNDLTQAIKSDIEKKIQSSLDLTSVQIIDNLRREFENESRSNLAHINDRIKHGIEGVIDLVSQRHHDSLEGSISLHSQKMSSLLHELLALDNTLSSIKKDLDSIRGTSAQTKNALEESSTLIAEQQKKGEELINQFMESMTIHHAMIENLSNSFSNSPFLKTYSFIKNRKGWVSGTLKFFWDRMWLMLGWLVWLTWMSGGISWMIQVGLVKAGLLLFYLFFQLPLGALIRKTRSNNSSQVKLEKKDEQHSSQTSCGQHGGLRTCSSNSTLDGDYYDSDPLASELSPRQMMMMCNGPDHSQSTMRRKISRQSLVGSRIVPQRLIINQPGNHEN